MVAKKRKTTKKVKDLGVKKVTSAQSKKIKGGGVVRRKDWVMAGGGVGRKDWVMV